MEPGFHMLATDHYREPCESRPNLNISYEMYDSWYNQMSVFNSYIEQMQVLCTMS